jgi:hypothetical protein
VPTAGGLVGEWLGSAGLDDDVRRVLASARFWTGYFWLTEEPGAHYPQFEGRPVTFRVSSAHALVLDVDPRMDGHELSLLDLESGRATRLGWNDQAHPVPNVFRWEELEAVCRCFAARDPALAHPGLPLLLLCPFAPVTAEDDGAAIRASVAAAFRRVAPLEDAELGALVDRACPAWWTGLRWRLSGERGGWVLEGDPAYSVREPSNVEFDLPKFEAFLDEARICAGPRLPPA